MSPVSDQTIGNSPNGGSPQASFNTGTTFQSGTDEIAPNSELSDETVLVGIKNILWKEFLCNWSRVEPRSIDLKMLETIVNVIIEPFVKNLLETTRQSAPHFIRVVGPDTLVPTEMSRSFENSGSCDEYGVLYEEVRAFVGSHDFLADPSICRVSLKKNVASKLPMSHPWQRWLCGGCSLTFPVNTVIDVCNALVPLLFSAAAACRVNSASKSAGAVSEDDRPYDRFDVPTARRYRRRIFALERELVAREKSERQQQAKQREEHERASQRLMDVNKQLEAKLRMRSDELKRAGQKIVESQRNVEESRGLLNEKKKEAAMLQYRIERMPMRNPSISKPPPTRWSLRENVMDLKV